MNDKPPYSLALLLYLFYRGDSLALLLYLFYRRDSLALELVRLFTVLHLYLYILYITLDVPTLSPFRAYLLSYIIQT